MGNKLKSIFKKVLQFLCREYVILTFIFFAALALRILHISTLSNVPPIADGAEYDIFAINILKGLGFCDPYAPASRGPGYLLFLSFIYLLYGHDYQIARIAQAILSSATCILIFLLAKKVFSRRTGYIAAAMGAFFTLFIFYSGLLYTEVLIAFLVSLLALNLLNALNKPNTKNLVTSGVILGITALTRAEVLFAFVFIALVFFINNKFNILKTAKEVGIILVIALVVIFPWTLRNYLVTKNFVLVSSLRGKVLWIGHNPKATGMSVDVPLEVANRYERYIDLDKALLREALDYIKNNRKEVLRLTRYKFSLYFRGWTDRSHWLFRQRFGFVNNLSPPLISLPVIGILGILGMILTIPYIKRLYLFYAFFLGNLLLQVVFFVEFRYHMQIFPFVIIFAASPVYVIERYIEKRDLKKIK